MKATLHNETGATLTADVQSIEAVTEEVEPVTGWRELRQTGEIIIRATVCKPAPGA